MTAGVLISKIATPLMDGIIVAITAGTFLYVGATEVRYIICVPINDVENITVLLLNFYMAYLILQS